MNHLPFLNHYSFFLFFLAGAAGGIYALAQVMKKRNRYGTKKKDTLVVGMYAQYRPFEFIDKRGKMAGFDVEYAQEVAKQLGLRLVIKNLTFEQLIPAVQTGQVDAVLSGMSITPERLKEIEMVPYHGKPLRSFALMFWKEVPEGIRGIQDIAEQGNNRIAVLVGTIEEDFIFRFDSKVVPKPVCSINSMLLEIRHGESLAALVKTDTAYKLQSDNPKIKVVEVTLPEKDWILGNGIGVRKGNRQLAKHLEQMVLELRQNGFAAHMHTKWFEKDAQKSE